MPIETSSFGFNSLNGTYVEELPCNVMLVSTCLCGVALNSSASVLLVGDSNASFVIAISSSVTGTEKTF